MGTYGQQALAVMHYHIIKCKLYQLRCRYMDSRAENGLTALHLAIISGSFNCVQLLLAAGADVMLETVDQGASSIVSMPAGSSLLHAAVESRQVAMVQAVLQVSTGATLQESNTALLIPN